MIFKSGSSQKLEKILIELAELNAKLQVARESLDYSDEIKALKRQISDLGISKSKLEEKNEREKREIEHMIGLEKKQAAMEKEIAVKEARVAIREENLNADKARFESEMTFMRTQCEKEMDRMESIYKTIIERLPTVTIDRTIEEKRS